MSDSRHYKLSAGVLAVIVVSAEVVALVMFLVKRSGNNDTADEDSTGSRITGIPKFEVSVSYSI